MLCTRILFLVLIIGVNYIASKINARESNETADVNGTISAAPINATSIPPLTVNLDRTETTKQNVTSTVDANQTEYSSSNATTPTESTVLSAAADEMSYQCNCDLTALSCDINCCCDPDCSVFNRQVFVDCLEAPSRTQAYDPRHCFKDDFIVRNNTHYKLVQTSDDLFCIYTDHFKQRLEYKEKPVITKAAQFPELVKKYSRYSWRTTTDVKSDFIGETYKVGSPLYIKYSSGQIGHLAFPRAFPMGVCNGNNPMSFLTSETSNCYQQLTNLRQDCERNIWLKGSTYFKNFEVARTVASLQDQSNLTVTASFLDVTPQLCKNVLTCAPVDDVPEPKYAEQDGKCHNAVSHVAYIVEHNGTEGLLNIDVQLTLRTVDASLANIWSQTFTVMFVWPSRENATSDKQAPFKRSGNPGYRMGAPIIAGNRITLHDDDNGDGEDVTVFDVKRTKTAVEVFRDPLTWLTLIGPSENGQCIWEAGSKSSEIDRLPVRFGRNMKSGCQLVISLESVNDTCRFIRNAAINALDGSYPMEVVAAYGNSNVENLDEWVPIVKENKPSTIHRSINTDTGCTSIVRELSIVVVHARTGHVDDPQPKILGVLFRYGAAEKLELRCAGRNCLDEANRELTQSFEVTTNVAFVDASERAAPIYPVPPALDIHLPYDFFYPFHESSAASKHDVIYPMCLNLILFTIIIFQLYFN